MATATPDQLREAITSIDEMAQHAFGEIAAISQLALASLETPVGYSTNDHMFCVLTAIANKAGDIENCINSVAEDVGCNYKDLALQRRRDARREADLVRAKTGRLNHG